MHPSGEQTLLRYEEQSAVLVEVGGGIRSYTVGDRPLLDGYAAEQMVSAARGQPLIPWPNRLHTGRYTWDGEEHVVPLDEPAQANAVHGVTRWRSWTAERESEAAATLRLRLLPQPAYPFALDLAVYYRLDADGLAVTTTATNVGDADAPYGQGAHPYLTVGGTLDAATLHLPATTWLPTGPAQIPIGREPVAGSPYDFREPRPIGPLHMDYAFTDLDRDSDGRCTLTLAAEGSSVSLWVDDHFPYVELYTGDTLPDLQGRRRGLGVEPMTCPPDAFRTGEDLVRLRPGQSWSASWGVRTPLRRRGL
ncbi:MAG: aldose 1-epimerase family protein [Actinomycetota bacterium]|jgi:aldose 1-epimerase|nr:aldose 1-epimerase family protein [Actinomycetota bacterium]